MENPKVSIIIPTYNYGHLIAETLDSLLNQHCQTWEAIIVDDGSTDDTATIVEPYLETDHRFNYIKQKNQGVSVARNKAIEACTGNYIQFLDADDFLSPSKIQNQLVYLQAHPDVDIVLSDTQYFRNGDFDKKFSDLSLTNEVQTTRINGKGFDVISDFVQRNQMVIQSPLFKKKILKTVGLFDERMHYLEDWDLWLRCAFANFSFAFLNDPESLSFVRVHAISASKNSDKLQEAEATLRRNITTYISAHPLLTLKEKSILNQQNQKELIRTFKMLMAKTHFINVKRWIFFYKQLQNLPAFYLSLLKSLNIKRKLK